ncbi:MAG: thiolase family protein [Holophagaceae bacterium]|nr:thiolase family protein [Holophagaceae bacterium]
MIPGRPGSSEGGAGPVLILAAGRLPQGRYLGALAGLGAVGLGVEAVARLAQDPALPEIRRVFWGMARSHSQGMNPARTIALRAGLGQACFASTVNMACGSSLQALIHGAEALALGFEGAILAGGSEAMSDTPHLLLGLRKGLRMGHREVPDVMIQDGLRCPVTGLLMGETVERLAARHGVSRADADAFALASHRKAAAADFRRELLPLPQLAADECVRPGDTLAALAALPPVFGPDGTITAGNASALADGAAAILLAREAFQGDAPVLGRILGWEAAAVDPLDMGEAPVPAVQRLLARHGLAVADINLWELNEAFAAQVLLCARQLCLPLERLNPAGGAVALGHPIGASGARIVVTLLHQLRLRGGGLGVATLGIGGGLGLALLLEADP